MKLFAAALFILSSTAAVAAETATFVKHVPKGWKLIDSAEGKLSKQSQGDAVLIIEQDDPAKKIANDGLGGAVLNLNPRRLVLLNKAKGQYRQVAAADGFLPTEGDQGSPCLVDPLDEGGVAIANGVVSLHLKYWMSCGSYGVSNRTFIFRAEAKRYRLIGFEMLAFSRSSGEGSETSINYLTSQKKLTEGLQIIEPEDGTPEKKATIRWSKIAPSKYYLDAMRSSDCDDFDHGPSWCGY
jgi:hypothetical protein